MENYQYYKIVIPLNMVEDKDVVATWLSMTRREHSEYYRLFKELIKIRNRKGRLDIISLIESINEVRDLEKELENIRSEYEKLRVENENLKKYIEEIKKTTNNNTIPRLIEKIVEVITNDICKNNIDKEFCTNILSTRKEDRAITLIAYLYLQTICNTNNDNAKHLKQEYKCSEGLDKAIITLKSKTLAYK